MIHQIAPEVYRLIREYGGLTQQQVADAIGRKHQVISRWEASQQKLLPKREQETQLVEQAKLTRLAFGEIMCRVLTPFVGRRFVMTSSDQYIPSLPLSRAAELYSLHRDQLDPKIQDIIEGMLNQGRVVDANAEQTCRVFEKEIVRLIEEAVPSGEDNSSNPGNSE